MISSSQPRIEATRGFANGNEPLKKKIHISNDRGVGREVRIIHHVTYHQADDIAIDLFMDEAKRLVEELQLAISEYEDEVGRWTRNDD